jgi:hypothetical protein
VVKSEGLGESVSAICVGRKKILETKHSTFLTGCCLPYRTCCPLCIDVSFKCLVRIVASRIVCIVVVLLCIMWSSYVYLLY